MDPILMQQLMMKQGGDSASSDIYEPTNSIERDEDNLDQELPVNNNEESFEDSLECPLTDKETQERLEIEQSEDYYSSALTDYQRNR